MRPGNTVAAPRLTAVAPAGIASFAPASEMRPFSMRITASSIPRSALMSSMCAASTAVIVGAPRYSAEPRVGRPASAGRTLQDGVGRWAILTDQARRRER